MNRRRALLLASAALVVAPGLRAQPDRVRRVGLLLPSASAARLEVPFTKRMAVLGWIAGRNLALEVRNANDHLDRLPSLAAELARLKVDVLVSASTPATRAASNAAGPIPVVFTWVGDPVGIGVVASLARPGGNVTGLCNLASDLAAKQLELLKALRPGLARVAELYDPKYPVGPVRNQYKVSAAQAGVALIPAAASSAAELEGAFATAARERATAMVIDPLPMYGGLSTRIAQLSIEHRIAAVSQTRGYPYAGGLVSYGPDQVDQFVRAANYVDRILRGARPADLPVEQPERFEMVINLKAAKALGIAVPQTVLLQATEVLE